MGFIELVAETRKLAGYADLPAYDREAIDLYLADKIAWTDVPKSAQEYVQGCIVIL